MFAVAVSESAESIKDCTTYMYYKDHKHSYDGFGPYSLSQLPGYLPMPDGPWSVTPSLGGHMTPSQPTTATHE